jgi:hypothetical protein
MNRVFEWFISQWFQNHEVIDIPEWEMAEKFGKYHGILPLIQLLHPCACNSMTGHQIQAVAWIHQAKKIQDVFLEVGIASMLWKGVCLGKRAYESCSLRECKDIDIFINANNLKRAADALYALGYESEFSVTGEQGRYLLSNNHALSFVSKNGETPVDLHWGLTLPWIYCPVSFEQIFEKRQKLLFHGSTLVVPSEEDEIFLLFINIIKDGGIHLKSFVDLFALMQRSTLAQDFDSEFSRIKMKNQYDLIMQIYKALCGEQTGRFHKKEIILRFKSWSMCKSVHTTLLEQFKFLWKFHKGTYQKWNLVNKLFFALKPQDILSENDSKLGAVSRRCIRLMKSSFL